MAPSLGADNLSLLSLYYDAPNIKLCHRKCRKQRETDKGRAVNTRGASGGDGLVLK